MAGKTPSHRAEYKALYWNWLASEAALLDTDGCSHVTGLRIECCYEHDVAYTHGKDPRSAYLHYVQGHNYWTEAVPISRSEADRRFWRCHCNRSLLGHYSPFAALRWLGVRLFGRRAWVKHRQREAA